MTRAVLRLRPRARSENTVLLADAVLAKSSSDSEAIWAIRDDIEALFSLYPFFTFDISVPLPNMESYVEGVQVQLKAKWPEHRCIVFGHLGDGNIHLILAMGSDSVEARREV